MKKYEVHSVCEACGDMHPTRFHVDLENGPDETKSVEEIWEGQEPPAHVKTIIHNQFQCPVNKTYTRQEENDQIFLVPLSYK